MCVGRELTIIILIAKTTTTLHPGVLMVLRVANHADIHSVEVLQQVFEAHPEHTIVRLLNMLDLSL